MGVELLLVFEKLLSLVLHYFSLLADFLFDSMATVVVLVFESLGFLSLEAGDLVLKITEIS
jgi:hypothetical protein